MHSVPYSSGLLLNEPTLRENFVFLTETECAAKGERFKYSVAVRSEAGVGKQALECY